VILKFNDYNITAIQTFVKVNENVTDLQCANQSFFLKVVHVVLWT